MTERSARPAVKSIKDAYDYLFNSGLSLSKIKDAAVAGRIFRSSTDSIGVSGRSIAWKIFLIFNQPLELPSDSVPSPPLSILQKSREEYRDLLLQKMRAPDGSYVEGFIAPGSTSAPKKPEDVPGNLDRNNPLSLHDENPWRDWFAHMDLRKTILQDVERTFPDIGYFRDSDVQYQLTNILFLYSIIHPTVGYRQGMHELLAPLYFAVDYDSIAEDSDSHESDMPMWAMCSRTWVAADAWALFSCVMRYASTWYEWQEPPAATHLGDSLITNTSQDISNGPIEFKPYVAPIVQTCNRIQSSLLRSVDPLLFKQIQAAGIEPQIYGIRWLRLLFTREFNMSDVMVLWDGLFACDPTLELVQWVCVAMLIRIRNKLIPSDYSEQLTYLLHYPTTPLSAPLDNSPHHASVLLRQASALQMSPTPSTGAAVMLENYTLLDIPVEVPDPPPAPARQRVRHGERGHFTSRSESRPKTGFDSAHLRQQPSSQMGLPELLARGLLERGESLGINRTLMSAISELRKNLPDLASSLVRSPGSSSSYAAFPLVDERPREERASWEPSSRFELERSISEMRARNKLLGESVKWILDVLQDDTSPADPESGSMSARKREALGCLNYVKDVLNGDVERVEEERLISEEERQRRRSKANLEKEVTIPTPATETTTASLGDGAATPRPVVASQHRPIGSRSGVSGTGPRPFSSVSAVHPRSQSPPPSSALRAPPFSPSISRSSSKFSSGPLALSPGALHYSSLNPGNHSPPSFTGSLSPLPRLTSRVSTPIYVPRPSSSPSPSNGPSVPSSNVKVQVENEERVQSDPLGALP